MRAQSLKWVDFENMDWEFVDSDTRYATHKFHPYSAKYIPQIPSRLIRHLTDKNDTVLDPFLGSGTTLIEANRLERISIGVDINPLACCISKVKTTMLSNKQTKLVYDMVDAFDGRTRYVGYDSAISYIEKYADPRIKAWFQKNILVELVSIKKIIDQYDGPVADFLFVGFSSILRAVSNAASGYGNLMINKSPPLKKNASKRFRSTIINMLDGMCEHSKMRSKKSIFVYSGNAKDLDFVKNESIDMICTHPPYMAAVPYAEYQKLSMWWMGVNNNTVDKMLIGGQRRRPDTVARFEDDMELAIGEMYRVLKPKKYCAIVMGNPTYRGKMYRLDKMMEKISVQHGFRHIMTIPRGKYKETVGKMKQEYMLIFRK